MTQTAVEFLVEHLRMQNSPYTKEQIIEIARQMEKHQHENTWLDSRIEYKGNLYIGDDKSFQQYYNETYEKQ